MKLIGNMLCRRRYKVQTKFKRWLRKVLKKFFIIVLVTLFLGAVYCYADTVKGTIDKVDLKTYEITVSGKIVKIAKAVIFTVNDMDVTKAVIIRDLKDHNGETVICYGSMGKDNIFDAYKVRVMEGHR